MFTLEVTSLEGPCSDVIADAAMPIPRVARSSRNSYLSPKMRQKAGYVLHGLKEGHGLKSKGETENTRFS